MKYSVLVFIFLVFEALYAQDNKVEGYVFDIRTNTPIQGVSVEIEDSFHETKSAADGYFMLKNVLTGVLVSGIIFIDSLFNHQK